MSPDFDFDLPRSRRLRSHAVIFKVCSSRNESGVFSIYWQLNSPDKENLNHCQGTHLYGCSLTVCFFVFWGFFSPFLPNDKCIQMNILVTRLWVKKKIEKKTNRLHNFKMIWQWHLLGFCWESVKKLHIRKVSATSTAPGLEFRDQLSVCISGASRRNNSILKTTVHDCTGNAADSWLVTGINCH